MSDLKVEPGIFPRVGDEPSLEKEDAPLSQVDVLPSPWVPNAARARSLVGSLGADRFVRAAKRPQPPVPAQAELEQATRMSTQALATLPLWNRVALLRALVRDVWGRPPDSNEGGTSAERAAQTETIVRVLETATDAVAFGRMYFGAPPEDLFDVLDRTSGRVVHDLYRRFAPTRGAWGEFASYLDGVADIQSSGANALDFLIDGPQVIDELKRSIKEATESVSFSTYIWEGDDVGWQMARTLAEKADQGIPVRLLLDKYGTPPSGSKVAEQVAFMKAHGVDVRFTKSGLFGDHLNHRKIVVVDGRVGFTGGMNVGRSGLSWHDQMTRLQGPAVAGLQDGFVDGWNASGPDLAGDELLALYPALAEVPGGYDTRVLVDVGKHDRRIQAMYLRAIETAKTSIRIANPYLTDAGIVHALCEAARSGVRVQVIIPQVNDVGIALSAARGYYPELIKAGVEVYEYKGRMAHEKVAIMDGLFTTFGSANLDARSFRHNDEINCAVIAPEFAADVERRLFDVDLRNSERITEHHPTLMEIIDRMLSGYL